MQKTFEHFANKRLVKFFSYPTTSVPVMNISVVVLMRYALEMTSID